jgi:cobalt-zinc-cadmium efflux system outer membrane protein
MKPSLRFPLWRLGATAAALLAIAMTLPETARAAGTGSDPTPLSLAQVLADVRAHQPALRSAQAMAAADRERIAQAGAWEDPVAGIELQRMNNTQLFSYDTAELQFSQKIPLAGNRERRRAVAAADAQVSAAAVRSREYMLVAEARDAFFQLLRAREQIELLRTSDRLLAQAADFVRAQLASGAADTGALLQAERERAQLEERANALEREAADAASLLNTLRDIPPQTPIGPLAPPADAMAFPSLEEAQAHALAHRPELAEADARVTAAARAQDLADRAWRPDPEVIVKARHLDGGGKAINDYDTGVAISLPWLHGDKYRAAQREAAKRREAAELDAAALRTKTAAEVRGMWQQIDTAHRNVVLYRDHLLPLARQTAETLRQGLVTGKNSLLELVNAQRVLVETQTTLAANLADYQRFRAMLETLTASSTE